MSKSYEDKIAELQHEVENIERKMGGGAKCTPKMLAGGAATPIVIWLMLYFLQPRFVQKKEGDEYTRDNGKVLWWTVIITLVLWALMYGYTIYGGGGGVVCMR